MDRKWVKWALSEAGTKTVSKLLQKLIGAASGTFAYTFFATAIVGLVQFVTGFFVAKNKGQPILGKKEVVFGACLFGFFATLSTVLGFTVFLYGGDIGINTFIVTLAIVPGALIDKFFFGHSLSARGWAGICVAIFAGYSVLGWPSLSEIAALPFWVWLSFGITFSVAANQGIARAIKKSDFSTMNFWGGLVTFILALVGLSCFGSLSMVMDFSLPVQKLRLFSVVLGFVVVAIWTSNLMSYKTGATIAMKKLVMNGTYLVSSMILGAVLFGESFGGAKIVGIVLYCVAFLLMDETSKKRLSNQEVE